MTTEATTWRKSPGSKILVGINWVRQLDGATLAGVPTVTGIPAGMSCAYAGTEGTIQKFWLDGDPGRAGGEILVTVVSSSGERLDHTCPVRRR